MKQNWINIVWVVLGTGLFMLSFAGLVDSFWGGMGAALFSIGVIRLLRNYRLNRNKEYRERMEIEAKDERNRFLSNKAWAWSGYLFILIAAVLSIIFKVMGQNLFSIAAGWAVLLMIVLYWGVYLVLRRKY